MRVSNPTSREVGPPLSYLGGCWGFCIGRLDKERNPAPLPVIEDHLPHSPQVGLSTLKHCRKMPDSNNQAASRFGGTSLSQLSVTTLPRFILHTAHTHVPKKKKKVHTTHCAHRPEAGPSLNSHKPWLTFNNFPVRKASFSRKSSAFSQELILYVLLIYSGFARSSTAPMWSSGVLIFST